MRKLVDLGQLIPHPENDFYFDRMEESKWSDFKTSIKENGLFEAPIVTPDNLIVSGHERVRACIELGMTQIEVEERSFQNDDAILTCLIETNIQQRGSIGGSVIKMARRIQALERCYNIRHGRQMGGAEIISAQKTQDQLAADMGMTARNLRMIRNLADLPSEFQEMVDNGKITPTTAAKLIVGLSTKEKGELLEYLAANDDSVKRYTEAQIADYIAAIQTCETKLKDYQELSAGDNEDYMRLVEERDKMKSEAIRSLSEATIARRELKAKEKELLDAKKKIGEFEAKERQLEETKTENIRLRQNGISTSQVSHYLNSILGIVNSVAGAEMPCPASKKEADKISSLLQKITQSLSVIGERIIPATEAISA